MRPSMRAGIPSRRSSASTVCRISSRNSSFEWRAALDGRQQISLYASGFEMLEGQVLQFAADFAHAQAVGDGRVDLDGLARDTLAPLGGFR